MQINDNFLSIPPYISTTWNNVKSLKMIGTSLQITLHDNTFVMIRDLEMDVVEDIFKAHALYLSRQCQLNVAEDKAKGQSVNADRTSSNIPGGKFSASMPFHFGLGGKEGVGGVLQHNIEFANAPDLPEDVISKIASIAKIVAPEDTVELPQPEPHCNCPHCQIARAINQGLGRDVKPFSGRDSHDLQDSIEVEILDDDDLKFEQWQIEQVGENLYQVINKIDPTEQYRVFLGSPVGCTCGKSGCEHIIAVLES